MRAEYGSFIRLSFAANHQLQTNRHETSLNIQFPFPVHLLASSSSSGHPLLGLHDDYRVAPDDHHADLTRLTTLKVMGWGIKVGKESETVSHLQVFHRLLYDDVHEGVEAAQNARHTP